MPLTAFRIHPGCIPPPLTGPSCPPLALQFSPSQIHVQTAANHLFHSSFTGVASLHRKHPHKIYFLHFIINPSLTEDDWVGALTLFSSFFLFSDSEQKVTVSGFPSISFYILLSSHSLLHIMLTFFFKLLLGETGQHWRTMHWIQVTKKGKKRVKHLNT